ncbi:MAG: hypothetical protein VB115_10110 [Christensenellaceae bacterium]|nr:hypothetical protein [Oscillibacter sp.]MEA4898587.1 hypothetical protein [Christensenellaceae bacterium]MEA4992583.1 hypothetical protein [Oscillibacter sp.]
MRAKAKRTVAWPKETFYSRAQLHAGAGHNQYLRLPGLEVVLNSLSRSVIGLQLPHSLSQSNH